MIINPYRFVPSYTTTSIRANTDRLTLANSSAPTSGEFMLSFWARVKTSTIGYWWQEAGNVTILAQDGSRFMNFDVSGISGIGGSANWTATTALGNDAWSHFILSVSVSNSRGQMYVDGVAQATITPTGSHNFSTVHSLFAHPTPTAYVDAEVAEWYLHCSASLDLSVAANLQKFRSSAGKPVDLGANGSTPTGSQPHYYHRGLASAFPTNLGSLGAATVANGALADGASSPSD